MKMLLLALGAVALSAAPTDSISQHDRDRLLSELHASRKMFLDSIAGLSHEQWVFKAGPDRWSIQETAEHIAAAEPFIRGAVMQLMKSPAKPEMAAERAPKNDIANEAVLKALTDRSNKLQAPEPLKPKDIYEDPKAAAAAFDKERTITLDYVRTTNDNLREHFMKSPTGTDMDGVQWVLLLAGHNERHVAQILEVKQSPNYPKN